jgi:hypothetical protein
MQGDDKSKWTNEPRGSGFWYRAVFLVSSSLIRIVTIMKRCEIGRFGASHLRSVVS